MASSSFLAFSVVASTLLTTITLSGCGGAGSEEPSRRLASTGLAPCQVPAFNVRKDEGLSGTLIANDKSKGVTWLFDLESKTAQPVFLPYQAGNHETAVSADGKLVAVPQYEVVSSKGQGEGSALAGWGVSVINISTGEARALDGVANPLGAPRPHDATYLDDGSILATAQVGNGMVRHMPDGSATFIAFDKTLCDTPHLVRRIPNSSLAVSGCRCTNADCSRPDHHGSLVVFDVDLTKGEYKTFDVMTHSEGIAVTKAGDVWIGSWRASRVDIFTFGDRQRTIENLQADKHFSVPWPIRLAYDEVSGVMAVASLDIEGIEQGNVDAAAQLQTFQASTGEMLKRKTLIVGDRGEVRMEGLRSFAHAGKGFFVTGGFDNQAVVVIEADTLETVVEIVMPRCPSSKMCDAGEPVTWAKAKADGETGSNNWSGGLCPATLRTPLERRWAVLDGFNYSPVRGEWAQSLQSQSLQFQARHIRR